MLIGNLWSSQLNTFRFVAERQPPQLFQRLGLDVSLVALLVEYGHACGTSLENRDQPFVRNNQRGQNLDRAGLQSSHMKVLNLLNSPSQFDGLVQQSGLNERELQAVLQGFARCGWIRNDAATVPTVVLVTMDPQKQQEFAACVQSQQLAGKVVRDALAVKLMLRRSCPDFLVVDLDRDNIEQLLQQLQPLEEQLASAEKLYVAANPQPWAGRLERVCPWPTGEQSLASLLTETAAAQA